MKQRVTFGLREKRRDQRRPIAIAGTIAGVRVDLVDLSLTGIGGGALELMDAKNLEIEEGDEATLEFAGADGETVRLRVTIQRIDPESGAFGATFHGLSEQDFDAIERLMFPRRRAAKSPAR